MIRRMRFCVPVLFLGALFSPSGGRLQASWFIRGDLNASESLNVTDAVQLLRLLFLGEQAGAACLEAADVDDDGKLTITDAVRLLGFLFTGGMPPAALLGGCWFDGTQDLGCTSFEPCKPVGLFFCIDKSASLGGAWRLIQDQVLAMIASLAGGDQFALVFFDSSIVKYPASGAPAQATPEEKAAAAAYVSATQTGHGSCYKSGLLAALQYANQSTARRKIIVCLGDGQTTCAGQDQAQYGRETLEQIKAANTNRIQINTLGTGPAGTVDVNWMKALAAQNGGHYAFLTP